MPAVTDDLRFAYITCGDLSEAERIGRALVGERLAACVNILPGLRSMFWWQGRIEECPEIILIAKTSTHNADAVVARVRSLHRYTQPCVVFLPVTGGNGPFLDWLRGEMVPNATVAAPTASVRRGPPTATIPSPRPG
jgi:periplasmic divalent cation tolerance protein